MPARFTRIDEISQKEARELKEVCKSTPGMQLYGHRARTAIMLPVELAKIVSAISHDDGKSVSEVINDILRKNFLPK
tara:strand:+ start:1187 stop:1417 length:231 start_codon:yes stop_codon:yes gene_type:complete